MVAGARCYSGQDSAGAFYWIAIPADWSRGNQVLVVHAHGGPELGAPRLERTEEDLKRWAVTVKAGYAWIGSSYRRGGYGVTMAAEDTERVRQLFVQHFGPPRHTLLHGQSYGGGVASKAVELFATAQNGKSPYDAVLLTSAVLGGGVVAYNFRLDLRVVYQYICKNHPRADEPQYPLWMGLPPGATLTRTELAQRVNDCTGLRLPAEQRSAAQQQRLSDILNVLHIPERSLMGHLNWATWLFEDVVHKRLQGRNPFGNDGVVYRGSSNDAALNDMSTGVLRYRADPVAVAALTADGTPTGRLPVPVLTLHAINDPTAFVELESNYRDVVASAGQADRLVQVFSEESEHSYLADPQYPALFTALLDWVEQGSKPTPQKVADLCEGYRPTFGGSCFLRPAYQPAPLERRVAPRRQP
ncbi:MAG: hypothetical protein Q7K57_34800 [Burkholderiaceae bacterium]|nr:hypothetical protein [Burkholderiaceae bacterium]